MAKTFVHKEKKRYVRRAKVKASGLRGKVKGSSHSGGRKHKTWWEGHPVEMFKDGKTQWVSKKYSTKNG